MVSRRLRATHSSQELIGRLCRVAKSLTTHLKFAGQPACRRPTCGTVSRRRTKRVLCFRSQAQRRARLQALAPPTQSTSNVLRPISVAHRRITLSTSITVQVRSNKDPWPWPALQKVRQLNQTLLSSRRARIKFQRNLATSFCKALSVRRVSSS